MMDFSKLPLRDWHVPEAVGWWPPAIGWWILLVAAAFGAVAIYWAWRKINRPTVKKLAKNELRSLRARTELSDSEQIGKLSILIRRICVTVYPRSEAAGLTGREWLTFLDKVLDEPAFSEGPGRVLISAPYQREIEFDRESLFGLCDRWIDALPECTVSEIASTVRRMMGTRR